MKSHTTILPKEGTVNDQAEARISCISAFCAKKTLLQKALIFAGFLVITIVALVVLIVLTKGMKVYFLCRLVFQS